MSIGAIGANALLSLTLRPNAQSAGNSIWSNLAQSPANSAQPPATIMPMGATMSLSFETVMNLQSQDDPEPTRLEAPSATQKFLEEARKSPIERMREQIMKELGISEEDLAMMSPDERRATEDKIREMIEEKFRQAAGADSDVPDSNASMIEVVA